ncbi:Mpo1-like protein [Chryseobacterium sp. MIQD13]|uniref:Mpo1-like protein n=1 Tax=Chryseobacterium sp. MIQD13 TaxID=3422310 RepID=UPI003D282DA2
MSQRIKTYGEFYQFYLTEHSKTGTRIFHFIGTLLVFVVIWYVISSGKERFLWYIPIVGYGFAWFSHAVIEKNKPATFKYPLWSLISDFRLFFELLTGKQKFRGTVPEAKDSESLH